MARPLATIAGLGCNAAAATPTAKPIPAATATGHLRFDQRDGVAGGLAKNTSPRTMLISKTIVNQGFTCTCPKHPQSVLPASASYKV